MIDPFSARARDDERLDAVVELGGEDVVPLGDVFERDAVRDDVARLEVAVLDVLEQARPLPLHRALVHAERQALVHGVAELHRAEQRTVGAHDRDRATLAHRVDRPVERDGGAGLQLELGGGDVLHEVAVRLRPHGVDRDVGPQVVGDLLHVHDDVVVLGEVVGLGVGEGARLLQPVLQVIDDDDPPGALSQADLAAKSPTGPAPKTTTTSPSTMSLSCAPKYPVASASVHSTASSSLIQSGIFDGPTSANGTRTYCDWPPSYPPQVWE